MRPEGENIPSTYLRLKGGFEGMATGGFGHTSLEVCQIGAVVNRGNFYRESLRSGLVMVINNKRNGWGVVVVVLGHPCAIHE